MAPSFIRRGALEHLRKPAQSGTGTLRTRTGRRGRPTEGCGFFPRRRQLGPPHAAGLSLAGAATARGCTDGDGARALVSNAWLARALAEPYHTVAQRPWFYGCPVAGAVRLVAASPRICFSGRRYARERYRRLRLAVRAAERDCFAAHAPRFRREFSLSQKTDRRIAIRRCVLADLRAPALELSAANRRNDDRVPLGDDQGLD